MHQAPAYAQVMKLTGSLFSLTTTGAIENLPDCRGATAVGPVCAAVESRWSWQNHAGRADPRWGEFVAGIGQVAVAE